MVVRVLRRDRKRDGNRRGQRKKKRWRPGPSYKILNSCAACPMSFSVSQMEGRVRKGQTGQDSLTVQDFILYGRGTLQNLRVQGRWQARQRGLLGLGKTRHKENGSNESLDSHRSFPVTPVQITRTACRRWLRTRVDGFKNIF